MDLLKTELSVEVDGIIIEYGRIPSGLIEGWNGIVYYFETFNAYNTKLYEKIVSKIIDQLECQSYDHGSEWRETKIEVVVWEQFRQITLVSFRVRDSY